MTDETLPRIPADFTEALERLKRDHPGTWLDLIADAVVEIGGTDADLLTLTADRAAAGIPADGGEGDPEAALRAMEADLSSETMQGTVSAKDVDLLAELPPVQPDLDDDHPRRSMN